MIRLRNLSTTQKAGEVSETIALRNRAIFMVLFLIGLVWEEIAMFVPDPSLYNQGL